MIDNKPTYTVRVTEMDGIIRYFTAFFDGSGIRQEIEINREIYLALEDCRKKEKRQQKYFDRYIEHLDLSEGQLAERIANLPVLVEDIVTYALATQAALEILPENHLRRYLLYHREGLSFAQIGILENCSKQAIAQSVGKAEAKIKNFFDEGG